MFYITRLLFLLGILWALGFLPAFSQPVLPVAPAAHAPQIDGRLNEGIWRTATVFTAFKTIQPDFGRPPTEATELLVTYDEATLYVAFRCHDAAPEKIKANLNRRDDPAGDDWVAFCLDSYNDELNAFFFLVNPLGIQADGTLDANAEPDARLDMVWESAGRLTDDGYVVEMAIPFRSLRFPPRDKVIMGFKAARFISRKSEEDDFPEFNPARGAALAQFQKIEFAGVQARRPLEVLPALTLSKNYLQQAGALQPGKTQSEFSLTAKVGLTPGLILDATYHPDFSQVETDAGQIDINRRAAVFYPEKRPFFLEGQEYFGFAAQAEETPLQAMVNTRTIIDPLTGVKLAGKLGKGHTLSALYALDELAPRTAFRDTGQAHVGVIRYARNLNTDSYLGAFFTGRRQAGRFNYVGGGDGRFRLNPRSSVAFHGFASQSRSVGFGDREGLALGAAYQYSTREWEVQVGAHQVSRDFRTDVGYLTRTGVTVLPASVSRAFYFRRGWLQRISTYYWSRHTYDHYSSNWETFNVIGFQLGLPRQTQIGLSAWLANESFAGRRFNRNTLRLRFESQPTNFLSFQGDLRQGRLIFYDPQAPCQGHGRQVNLGVFLQPTGRLSSGFDISYADFSRQDDGEKMYDVLIFRNRTTFQFNKYLFARAVLEYNRYYQRLGADFLLSFTYIPGTVLYLGYGAQQEQLQWADQRYVPSGHWLTMRNSFFFKASYLLRR